MITPSLRLHCKLAILFHCKVAVTHSTAKCPSLTPLQSGHRLTPTPLQSGTLHQFAISKFFISSVFLSSTEIIPTAFCLARISVLLNSTGKICTAFYPEIRYFSVSSEISERPPPSNETRYFSTPSEIFERSSALQQTPDFSALPEAHEKPFSQRTRRPRRPPPPLWRNNQYQLLRNFQHDKLLLVLGLVA